jgi:acetamidase/formamidase
VEGAEPGDTLVLHLVALEPARDWGASAAMPFFGGMTSTDRVVTLQEPLPDTTWIYELDWVRKTVAFAARHSDHRIELPVEPMLGTVGVAPVGGEVRSSLVPDHFGGTRVEKTGDSDGPRIAEILVNARPNSATTHGDDGRSTSQRRLA